VEEVSGQTFESFMQDAVFKPLGMTRSTYAMPNNRISKLAASYDTDGSPATHYNFTAVSAAGLYTTTADLTRFVQGHHIQPHLTDSAGAPMMESAMKPATLKDMRHPHGTVMGLEIWGLGTILYTPNGEQDHVFGHDGKNDPAINTSVRINPATGDGFILLQSGNDLLATTLGSEWVFWQTGKIDRLTLNSVIDGMMKVLIPGWIVIIVCGLVIGWRIRKSR
jgi:CubicO group peptidase (beta-lactamase class C family)